ncbi:MAG: glycosyltransferase family 2 protein [Candidatus Aminicenantes bacterium]|nr:glycosyltransferase family 2 protein [Candidatus Aminicenantes bacterium]
MSKISVIVAALNEEQTIRNVIKGIKKSFRNIPVEIIVVDNGSRDRTGEIAKEEGAIVVFEPERGKGSAVLKGIEMAKGDILALIDADDSYPAESLPALIEPIERGEAEVVFGSRFHGKRVSMSFLRFIGNKVLTYIASITFAHTTDLLTGMLAAKRDAFSRITLKSSGFEVETEFFIKCVKKRLKRKEIPIEYTGRKNSHLNPLIDGVKILCLMIKEYLG